MAKLQYAIFRKGFVLDKVITDNIIAAAKRGKITEAGKKVLLVPDKRHGETDSRGLQDWGRVRRAECILLKNLVRK